MSNERSAFTDDDLKRLKKVAPALDNAGATLKVGALIARLEAAEALCNQAEHYRWSGMSQLLDAWRKAAGK